MTSVVPFDPELAVALAAADIQLPTEFTIEGLHAARRYGQELAPSAEELARGGRFEVTERFAPGPAGAPPVPLLVCRPTAESTATRPTIFFTHGGGMVSGNCRLGLDSVLDWAQEIDAVVASVEYRLAPENPYPAGIEDVYAALMWTVEHAGELGGHRERIVLAGGSAGGGLTAALTLLLRDRGGPTVTGQMLLCPMLDDRNESFSGLQMAGLGTWDRTVNGFAWRALLGEQCGGPDVSPYAAPARARDLAALPPTLLDVGSADTFRDEVVAYASRIWQAGGVAELHVWPGGFHGFEEIVPQAAVSREAQATRVRWLRRLLGA